MADLSVKCRHSFIHPFAGKKATHTQTLKGNMLELLGIWAKSYPNVVHNPAAVSTAQYSTVLYSQGQ
jgi:hypothetical protein